MDEKKEPVQGALVTTLSGSIATTDINGEFLLENVMLNKNVGFIKAEKAGYFTGSRTFVVSTTTANNTQIQLIPKTSAGSLLPPRVEILRYPMVAASLLLLIVLSVF